MSKEAVLQFFQSAATDPDLQLRFRSITDKGELFKLGRRHGFHFSGKDLAEATTANARAARDTNGSGLKVARIPESLPSRNATSRILHHEWSFDQLQGLDDVARDLDAIRIRPATVDLGLFDRHSRPDDREFADISPVSPGFRARYDEIMVSEADRSTEFSRRPFHLVNLDEHTDDDLYDDYFLAKTRLVSSLERLFGDEVRFSGSMWYPPNGYRAWHTNETQPGWRMYLIDFDGSEQDIAGKSFFRYMNPQTGELVTLFDRPKLMRFFKVEQESDKLLWHCIVNDSAFNRWSFGFMVAESWMKKLI